MLAKHTKQTKISIITDFFSRILCVSRAVSDDCLQPAIGVKFTFDKRR